MNAKDRRSVGDDVLEDLDAAIKSGTLGEALSRIEEFVSRHRLQARIYRCDPARIVELAFKHYPSQVEEVYRKGVMERAEQLRVMYGTDEPCDRMFIYPTVRTSIPS